MTPQEIRQLRKDLGLTQEAAGALLGVGPSAFHKYETGKSRPGTAACELLVRIRQEDRVARRVPNPWQLGAGDTERLNGRDLEELLDLLLHEEKRRNSLPDGCIAPRTRFEAGDGGVDAEICWPGEPDRTEILPARHVGFQAKARRMSAMDCGRELQNRNTGAIKPEILRILEQGGHYVIFCNKEQLSRAGIENRRRKMQDAVQDALQQGADAVGRLDFWDANRITDWVNRHIVACEFVRRSLGLRGAGRFVSLEYLAGEQEHCGDYFSDHERDERARQLCKMLAEPNAVVRVTGSAGIGKTRFVLEALRGDRQFCDSALYADAARFSSRNISEDVRDLVQAGHSGLIIIDNCAAGWIRELTRPAGHRCSALKMIAIDDEPGEKVGGIDRIELKGADGGLIEGILRSTMPGQASLNIADCVKAAAGFPGMARLIAQDHWRNTSDIVDSSACYRMLSGAAECSDDLKRAAQLLAVFTSVGFEGDSAAELERLARLGESMTTDKLCESIDKLRCRGLLRTTDGRIGLKPLPLAWSLAKKQWQQWQLRSDSQLAQMVLGDSLEEDMQERMLMRMQELGDDENLVRQSKRLLSGISGPGDFQRLLDDRRLLDTLAQFAPVQLAKALNRGANFCLAHHAGYLPDVLAAISRKDPQAFVSAAGLLFELAAGAAATRQQAAHKINNLFASPAGRSDSLAGEKMRLLGDLYRKASTKAREDVLLQALALPFDDRMHRRHDNPALRGAANRKDESTLLRQYCLRQLVSLCVSQQTDLAGRAREVFTRHLRGMLALLPFDKVAAAVTEVAAPTGGYFPEAVVYIGEAMCYDWRDDSVMTARLAQLCSTLGPRNLHEQIDFFVSRCANHNLCMHEADSGNADGLIEQLANRNNKAQQMCEEKVRQLAEQLAPAWRRHWGTLANLAASEHQRAHESFGEHLYRFAAGREELARRALEAAEKAAASKIGGFAFLAGIVRAAAADNPVLVDELLGRIAANDAMSSALVFFCRTAGLTEARLALLAESIAGNPARNNFLEWLTGSCLGAISEEHAAAFAASLLASYQDHPHHAAGNCTRFLYSFASRKGVRLEKLAQVFHELLARLTPEFWKRFDLSHELTELTMRFLPGSPALSEQITGRTVEIATQALTRAMEDEYPEEKCFGFFYSVMQKALAERPEIAWPPLGERIAAASETYSFIPNMKMFFARTSLLRKLPEEMLLEWCDRDRKVLLFALAVLPVLQTRGQACDIDELTLKLVRRYEEDNPEIYRSLTLRADWLTCETMDSRQKLVKSLEKLTNRPDLPWGLGNWLKEEYEKECETWKMLTRLDRWDYSY